MKQPTNADLMEQLNSLDRDIERIADRMPGATLVEEEDVVLLRGIDLSQISERAEHGAITAHELQYAVVLVPDELNQGKWALHAKKEK